jgi:phosphate transport system substrate-binding protein
VYSIRIVIFALVVAMFAACGGSASNGGDNGPSGDVSGTIVIDGSSTVGPIAEAAAEEFGKVSDANVVVGISGTGGGFEKFCRGEIDISDASRPVRASETQTCADAGINMTEFRIAMDGLTVVVHPDNDWATCLKYSQLRRMFEPGSTVKNWRDVDPSFPDEPPTFFSPGADSGTFDYLTEEVVGSIDSFRSDNVTFSEDDNVLVHGVGQTKGAIGYFGYAYYTEAAGDVKALQIDRDVDRAGQPLPQGQSSGCIGPDPNTVTQQQYALSRPLFMYASNKSLKDKPQVRSFIEFVLTNPQLIADVGYIRLQDADYQQNLAKLRATTE